MRSPPTSLPERYVPAWNAVVAALDADPEVLGATISGSVLRGLGGPTSDLDVYVLIAGAERWRRTHVVEGVLVEEFRNPEPWIRRYVERRDDAPGLHMLGHGEVVLDRHPTFLVLREEAARAYALGPKPLPEPDALYRRYSLWDAWCDVKDLLARGDHATARGLIQRQVARCVDAHHELACRWTPKTRDLLVTLPSWAPGVARELRALWCPAAADLGFAFSAYDRLVRLVLAPHDPDQPFTWTSERERVK